MTNERIKEPFGNEGLFFRGKRKEERGKKKEERRKKKEERRKMSLRMVFQRSGLSSFSTAIFLLSAQRSFLFQRSDLSSFSAAVFHLFVT